ncbi:hypothetical protein TWF718_003762 [Orbilia javanica]|uniref:RING-type domain-containing protein n=1 Tax=Orbilia javanica TaxID=47235 RepID=A0AAN8RKH2_9PEZI
MAGGTVPTSIQIQVSITVDDKTISIASTIYFWFHLVLWLLPLFRNHIDIFIGLEKSCPDASKHFAAFPSYTTSLFAQNGQPNALSLQPKEDTRIFIRKAYQRYLHRKYSETGQLTKSFLVDDDGMIQRVSEWRAMKQRGASPIYSSLQNCTLKNLQKSTSTILIWQLCRDFGTFNFPWTDKEIDCGIWRHSVDYSFFGTDRSWAPVSFQTPMEELNTCQIKNRIAVLGESVGWSPDIDEEIEDSEEIVAFRQEIEATCFFCYDKKPIWQMCVLHCAHISCIDCVGRNYKLCLEDTSRLPPSCCKKYPIIYASTAAQNTTEINRLARWIVTGINPSPLGQCYACSKDIWPNAECGDIGLCISCNERTCLRCNVKWHDFERVECRLGQLSGFFRIIAANGWSQCYNCGLVVERSDGCAHIKCRCGADFCYHCGGKWPNCPCRTNGQRMKIDITRDQAAEDNGKKYTKNLSAKHQAKAIASEQKFMDIADVLNLLRIIKAYQVGVAREIRNLRKKLQILKENEEGGSD